jgi:glycogen synthase
MRILHILDHSLPLHSGYSFRTASILTEQRALGWETVHVTTPRHGHSNTEVESAGGWSFFRTPFAAGPISSFPGGGAYADEMIATARRVASLVEQTQPDVLHAHSPLLTVLPALWVGRRKRVPVVYEIRALWEDGAVDHGVTKPDSFRYRLTRSAETFAIKRANRVTTICEGLRHEITSRGISDDRITVIPNAVDTDSFAFDPPPDQALREQLGLANKSVLAFIGSFYGYEGLELLVDAFAALCERRPEARLLMAGGGPSEAALRKQVERLRLLDRVTFTGRVPHADVHRYYGVTDVLVYPRLSVRVTEIVTPLKPLEAMAQGRVLVASDVGGHRELIRDNETGFLFSAGNVAALTDKLDQVLKQRDQWERIRQTARRFVERERTWKSSVARYSRVYESAIKDMRPA